MLVQYTCEKSDRSCGRFLYAMNLVCLGTDLGKVERNCCKLSADKGALEEILLYNFRIYQHNYKCTDCVGLQ